MVTGLDWKEIRKELDLQDWEKDDFDETESRRIYIGTVFNLLPSGKYYQPFACSHVTDEEAELDEEWYEALEAELNEHGMFYDCGEGDPCDMFVGEFRYNEEMIED